MQWLIYALIAALLNGIVDFMFKLSSGKIDSTVGGIILNFVGIIPLSILLFLLYQNSQLIHTTKNGTLYMVIAGLCVGFISVFMFKMFSTGQNISIATPVMRISGIVFASLLGIIFLKEAVTLKYIVGFVLSLIGVFLISIS